MNNQAVTINTSIPPNTWRVKLGWDEVKLLDRSFLKVFPVHPDSFSDHVVDYLMSVVEKRHVEFIRQDRNGGREHIRITAKNFLCLYFISTHLDFLEFDKNDFQFLRNRFLSNLNQFYIKVYKTFLDKVHHGKLLLSRKSPDAVLSSVYQLKNFQLDLIREGVEKKGRFILNEKKIVGKRVIAYLVMRFFQDKNKKIIIIAAKKNTHHWRELICQWDDNINKKNIILYKKEHKVNSLMKKSVIIINDNLVKECFKDSPQLFNKNSNMIIDKEVQFLEEIAEKIKDYSVRVGYICQNFTKLKIVEKLALNTLFDCVRSDIGDLIDKSQLEGSQMEDESVHKTDKKLENLLISNNQIQKYFISLDDKTQYPEFDFRVVEQAFIINYDDEEIEKIKSLKNMVTNGNSEDIIRTYKDKFEKNDEDIRNMSKNLKGTFKDPEKYFYNHSLESMKRAIDFYCTKLFAETKINHTKTIIEKLILSGKKKIVIWAFHCNILQKIAAFIKDLKTSKGYKVLEVTSNMPDDKRNEIIVEYNKLEVGFLIIPFSVKKERFKNLDFDVFLFVELTYNLEYYLTARKILYSPYLTKDKHLYIILSPPADSYIWIKFETIYKRPEWEKCIKELKEKNLSFVIHDLEVKDDKNKTMSSDLEQIKIQLEINNQKLKLENKKKFDKVKELRDKKKTNKKTNIYEIEPYINGLSENNILSKDEADKFLSFYEMDTVKIDSKLYVSAFNPRKDPAKPLLAEVDRYSIDLFDIPDQNRKTLARMKESDRRGLLRLVCDRLDHVGEPEAKIWRVEQDFDVCRMQQSYREMTDALGENKFTNLSSDMYTKTIEDLGFDVELKDPTTSSKTTAGASTSSGAKETGQEEDDDEFYDEMMNMLIGAYVSVQRQGRNLGYFHSGGMASSSADKGSRSMEASFERNVMEGMVDIREYGNYTRMWTIIDKVSGNVKVRELVKENFRLMVKQSGESMRPKYVRVDFNEQVGRSVRKEREREQEEELMKSQLQNAGEGDRLGEYGLKIEPMVEDDVLLFGTKREAISDEREIEGLFNFMGDGNERDKSEELSAGGFFLGKRRNSIDSMDDMFDRGHFGMDGTIFDIGGDFF